MDGGTYSCMFRYGSFKKVFGNIYVPVKVDHVHINKDGIKEKTVKQGIL